MKYRILTLLLVFLVPACGEKSSPAAPTRIPAANISSTGNLTTRSCSGNSCSAFEFSLTNAGPGCASQLDLAGTVTLTTAAGTSSTANWKLPPGEQVANGGFFRPGDTRLATNDGGTLNVPGGSNTYRIAITKQTDMKCP